MTHPNCRCVWIPPKGPGTALKEILEEIGIRPTPDCPCLVIAAWMDYAGLRWCMRNRGWIMDRLEEGYRRWGWYGRMRYALKFAASGWAFSLPWSNPFPELVEAALARSAR